MYEEHVEFNFTEKSLGELIPGKFYVKTSVNRRVRTASVEGVALWLPEVGKRFYFVGVPLSIGIEAGFRVIATSIVVDVERISETIFVYHTESGSIYLLELTDALSFETSAILEVIRKNKVAFVTCVSGLLNVFGIIFGKEENDML
jgi:hypothetical protein